MKQSELVSKIKALPAYQENMQNNSIGSFYKPRNRLNAISVKDIKTLYGQSQSLQDD